MRVSLCTLLLLAACRHEFPAQDAARDLPREDRSRDLPGVPDVRSEVPRADRALDTAIPLKDKRLPDTRPRDLKSLAEVTPKDQKADKPKDMNLPPCADPKVPVYLHASGKLAVCDHDPNSFKQCDAASRCNFPSWHHCSLPEYAAVFPTSSLAPPATFADAWLAGCLTLGGITAKCASCDSCGTGTTTWYDCSSNAYTVGCEYLGVMTSTKCGVLPPNGQGYWKAQSATWSVFKVACCR